MKMKIHRLSFFVVTVILFINSILWVNQVNCRNKDEEKERKMMLFQLTEHVKTIKPKSGFNIGKRIGYSRSEVRKCISRKNGLPQYAIKKLRLETSRDIKHAINELEITKEYLKGNDHFVKFYDAFYYKKDFWMVVSRIRGTRLDEIDARRLETFRIIKIAHEILKGLHFLQKNNICHSDLFSGNIMIDKDDKVFIIDFGAARIIQTKYSQYANSRTQFRYTEGCNDLSKFYEMMVELVNNARNGSKPLKRLLTKLHELQRQKITIEELLESDLFTIEAPETPLKRLKRLHKRSLNENDPTSITSNHEIMPLTTSSTLVQRQAAVASIPYSPVHPGVLPSTTGVIDMDCEDDAEEHPSLNNVNA